MTPRTRRHSLVLARLRPSQINRCRVDLLNMSVAARQTARSESEATAVPRRRALAFLVVAARLKGRELFEGQSPASALWRRSC